MFKGIDFYSDTVTRPTAAMKKAMVEAEVGDEQKGEDPTTLRLEAKVAELLGHTGAMFFPSATMANEVALLELGSRGDELLAAAECHLFFAEAGGPAALVGLMTRAIPTANGIFTAQDVRATFRQAVGSHYPVSRVLSVENTTNMGGGYAWPLETLDSVLATARELKMVTHLDGSRLFNAATATGCAPKRITSGFDTATICLSKGLGCPAGAVLVFDQSRWASIRKLKQRMGGSLRQSGMLAAAGLYALENHVSRIEEDHTNARRLAEGLIGMRGIEVENTTPSSNMVFFRWKSDRMTPEEFLETITRQGLRFSHVGPDRFRAVTHLDIRREDVEKAFSILKEVCR
jgi:threonine aldolase